MFTAFLDIAKKDLEAAKHLLERKLYPHPVFHMQQSTEKALRSLGDWIRMNQPAQNLDG